MISPAKGAVGRRDGYSGNSQHNYDRWGEVRALDIMPFGMTTALARKRAFNLAKQVGFTGIGVYPEWTPRPGLHVDVRMDRTEGNPATWSAFFVVGENGKRVQQYFGLDKALS